MLTEEIRVSLERPCIQNAAESQGTLASAGLRGRSVSLTPACQGTGSNCTEDGQLRWCPCVS